MLSDSDLLEIETALNCKLPESFKSFMRDYPKALVDTGPTYDTPDGPWTERPCDNELTNRAEVIIALTKARPAEWPTTRIVIGENGCGDLFGIDTAIEDSPVYKGGPHPGESPDSVASSLRVFADNLIAQYKSM